MPSLGSQPSCNNLIMFGAFRTIVAWQFSPHSYCTFRSVPQPIIQTFCQCLSCPWPLTTSRRNDIYHSLPCLMSTCLLSSQCRDVVLGYFVRDCPRLFLVSELFAQSRSRSSTISHNLCTSGAVVTVERVRHELSIIRLATRAHAMYRARAALRGE